MAEPPDEQEEHPEGEQPEDVRCFSGAVGFRSVLNLLVRRFGSRAGEEEGGRYIERREASSDSGEGAL